MTRFLATAAILAVLLPATAEAAKFRGGRSAHADKPAGRSTLIVAPGLAGAARAGQAKAGEAGAPPHVPFPTPSALPQPQMLQASAQEEKKPWCRSAVVGGFCVIN